jgi:tetratricopeptide (TPR) repeat protein
MGESPKKRLAVLEANRPLVAQRDDLSVELCALYNQTSQPQKALAILTSRRFQPWEGGEGQALGQYVRARLALGRSALATADAREAVTQFELALQPPENLAESKHLLANQSDIHYWLGAACHALGDSAKARRHWKSAAEFKGDFQGMKVRAFSEMTYYSAIAWRRLGQDGKANRLLRDLLAYARELHRAPAAIDYFATSLPTMLLFDDDLESRQHNDARLLEAQARAGLGETKSALAILRDVLRHNPNQPVASDLLHELSRKAIVSRPRSGSSLKSSAPTP